MDKDERLKEYPYNSDLKAYAMAKINFFSCSEKNCSEPAHNGLVECAQLNEQAEKVLSFCK